MKILDEQDSKDIKKWYYDARVKFSMINSLNNREMSCLIPSWCEPETRKFNIRTLRVHSVQHLDFIYSRLKIFEDNKPYNYYYSLAKYQIGLPYQDMRDLRRDNKDWILHHHKQMIIYDFVLDIDAGDEEDIKYAYLSAKNIKTFLDLCDCPHEVRFSGRGFHFVIPYDYFLPHVIGISLNPKKPNNIYKYYYRIANYFSKHFSEMVDLKIYDSRRLLKIPYTLAIYEDNIFVCSPFFNRNDFYSFIPEQYKLNNYNKDKLGQGLHLFNKGKSIKNMLIKIGMIE